MSAANNGGPAFPVPLNEGQSWQGMAPCDGMTLRDYFAAKAMQSVLDGSWPDLQLSPNHGLTPVENSAVFAYEIADAMLRAREQKVSTP